MKPGYQTTEFWVTILTLLGSILGAFHIETLNNLTGNTQATATAIVSIIGGISAIAYTISRTFLKKNTQSSPVTTSPQLPDESDSSSGILPGNAQPTP